MARKALVALALAALAALAAGARLDIFEVRTSGGYLFDVMAESSMGISDGLSDAYDGCYMLRVGGAEVQQASAAIIGRGRGLQGPRVPASGIKVSRQIYVPEKGDWARYYDVFVNDSKAAQTVDVELFGNLGSDSSTKIVTTSDGDGLAEVADTWIATDDYADGSGDPSLAHVFRRDRGKMRPESVTITDDNLSIRYRLKLGPQKSAAVLFFAVQTTNSGEAARLAKELAAFGAPAREGLGAEAIRIIAN